MAPTNAPERRRAATPRARKIQRENTCDMHASARRGHRVIQIAVTSGQLAIVEAAVAWRARRGEWPSAASLATAAEFTRPDVWDALKALERLGVVRWRRRVEVVRRPDGVLFLPPSATPSTLYFPRAGA